LKVTDVAPVNHLPIIVTVEPTAPCFGAKLPMVGSGNVKLKDVHTVPAVVVTQTGPVNPPTGGVVRITKLFSTVNVG